jgi:RNA polymerase sigma-70 factor (ECF subfamily)
MSEVIRALVPDSDDQLVALAVAGDLRAFERLVERHRDTVYRVAARVAGEDEADDVTQDTFLRAYHRLDRYRGDGAFRAWVLQIAHNTAVSTTGRQPAPAVPLSELEDDAPAAPAGTPADEVEGRERRRRLDIKVKGLSPQHRAVLVLRDIEGLSYDEIASVTDTPVGSVKARLHRARGQLIDLLRRNTYDWELPSER